MKERSWDLYLKITAFFSFWLTIGFVYTFIENRGLNLGSTIGAIVSVLFVGALYLPIWRLAFKKLNSA